MHHGLDSRRRGGFAWVLVVLLLAAGPGTAWAKDEALAPEVRAGIEEVVQKRIADLAKDKDADGIPYKRGTYSKTFRKGDGDMYHVTFHQDTMEKDAEGHYAKVKTERYDLAVKKGAGGKWELASADVKDTFSKLRRSLFGEDIRAFESLSFEKEGLKVSSGPGLLYTYKYDGKVMSTRIMAVDLKYTYAPPADVTYNYYQIIMKRLLEKYPDDLFFKPEWLRMTCDPSTCDKLLRENFKGLTQLQPSGKDAPASTAPVADKFFKLLADVKREADKDFKENPFGAFFLPERDEYRNWTFSFKRDSAKDHFFTVDYDNFEPWEVGIYVTGYAPRLFAYYSEDTRKSSIPPYELEMRDDRESLDYQLEGLKGQVDLSIEREEGYSADLEFTIVSKRELNELPFAISRVRFPGDENRERKNPKLFINSIQDEGGNELTFVKTFGYGGLVAFPKPIPAGTSFKLRMQFTSNDSIAKLNPSYFYVDRGGWLPFVRFTDMIQDFDMVVRVPDRYKAFGPGREVSRERKSGIETTHWVAKNPVSFPTVIFGQYIEDSPEIKATKKDGTVIPVRVHVDTVSTNSLDSSEAGAEGARSIRGGQLRVIGEQAVNALNIYRELYGVDYPYDKLDLVADPLGTFYGQAPASIIYLGWGVFRGEGALADGDLARFNKDVVAHETGHQWWGSLCNNVNDRNYWFVESLAEYSSAIFVESLYGRQKYLEKVADWRRNILNADVQTPVQNAYTTWSGETGFRGAIANIYNKGPYAFHVLRSTFGDDKFFAFMKKLANDYKHGSIITRDIQQAMESAYGGTMEWFFDQWLRGVGVPQYSVSYTIRKTEDQQYLIEGSIKQRTVMGKEKIPMPGVFYRGVAPFTFVFHNGKEAKSKPILIQGEVTPFKLKLPDEPKQVVFNKDGEILAHDVLYNQPW